MADWREYANFTRLCRVCGVTVAVKDGREEPHRCRIEVSHG